MPGSDKVVHAVLYAVLGWTLALGRVRTPGSLPHVWPVLAGCLYGATDEWHQWFVPGRFVSFGDWVADVVGVVLGYTLYITWIRRRSAVAPVGGGDRG